MSDSVIPWTAGCQAPLFSTISQSLLKFMSIKLVTLSNHLILCCPLLLWPSIFPSIRVFSNEVALHTRWPKYWSFSISPSNEYSGLIFFGINQFDLLAVLSGTLKSLFQYHNLKVSILQHSAFFMVQVSHPYMTTGKTIALITGKSVLLNSSPLNCYWDCKSLEPDNLSSKPGFTTDKLYDVGKFLNCSLPQFPHL